MLTDLHGIARWILQHLKAMNRSILAVTDGLHSSIALSGVVRQHDAPACDDPRQDTPTGLSILPHLDEIARWVFEHLETMDG